MNKHTDTNSPADYVQYTNLHRGGVHADRTFSEFDALVRDWGYTGYIPFARGTLGTMVDEAGDSIPVAVDSFCPFDCGEDRCRAYSVIPLDPAMQADGYVVVVSHRDGEKSPEGLPVFAFQTILSAGEVHVIKAAREIKRLLGKDVDPTA